VWQAKHDALLKSNPRFRFQPFTFSPGTSKSTVLLKLRGEPATYSASDPGVWAQAVHQPEVSHEWKPHYRFQLPAQYDKTPFDRSDESADFLPLDVSIQACATPAKRLLTSSHFVAINGTR
jgi:hypothetical protein